MMTTKISLNLDELAQKEISFYLDSLTQQVKKKIKEDITNETINDTIEYQRRL